MPRHHYRRVPPCTIEAIRFLSAISGSSRAMRWTLLKRALRDGLYTPNERPWDLAWLPFGRLPRPFCQPPGGAGIRTLGPSEGPCLPSPWCAHVLQNAAHERGHARGASLPALEAASYRHARHVRMRTIGLARVLRKPDLPPPPPSPSGADAPSATNSHESLRLADCVESALAGLCWLRPDRWPCSGISHPPLPCADEIMNLSAWPGVSKVAAMTDDDLPPRLTRLTFHGPLSEARAARLVGRLTRPPPATVLE